MRLLLLSNSTNHGSGYLDHAMAAILDFFGPTVHRIGFVPFALHDQEAYLAKARGRFVSGGIEVAGLTADAPGLATLASVDGLFVGGGNTFRLLDRLQRSGLLEAIRERVRAGLPYMGASAGTNVAAPTIKTTNDMPILQPASFAGFGFVPFQINPHYVDADPTSRHMGETREDRLREYLEENDAPVVGLREGGWLKREGATLRLEGASARIFRRGAAPEEVEPGADVSALLG
jgi:dipeptidase E